jgi:rhodanese-related sulfurtransferase
MKTLPTFLFAAMAAVTAYADSTNVTPDEAEKLLKENKGIVVLDVRTAEEFSEGHIAGAKNLDFHGDDFAKQLNALDKSKTYLVHCASGGRSAKACKLMGEDKFSKIYHMNGGFSAWKQAGKPIAK